MLDTLLSLFSRLAGLFGRRRAEEEFDNEIAGHLEMLTADNIRRGMSPDRAKAAARRAFGGVTQVKETQRELRAIPQLDILMADLRYAARMLRHNPGFTLVAVLTLALGIGVNTTLFSAFNAVALKPLPIADPGSAVRLERWFEPASLGDMQYAFSYSEYAYLRDQGASFSALVASSWPLTALSGQDKLTGEAVSGNYFSALGIHPALGRTFLREEDGAPGAHPVIVLSHNFWDRHYHRDPLVLGQSLKLNDLEYTIVGVAPEDFPGTAIPAQVPDFWTPVAMYGQIAPGRDWRNDPTARNFVLLGRLAPGVAIKTAQAQAAVLLQQFARAHPTNEPEKTITLTLQRPTYLGNTEDIRFLAFAAAMMVIVGLVWLIACANLANMLLARTAARRREIAVRLALGAARSRLVRQLLTESILLAVVGGAAGLAFSSWASRFLWLEVTRLLSNAFGGVTIGLAFSPDLRVYIYTLALASLTGVVFGLSPALQFTRTDLTTSLKQDGATFGVRLSRSRFRSFLVASQVGASMLLMIIAGLLVRGLLRSRDAQPGFDTSGVYLFRADLGPDARQAAARQQALLHRLREAPELRSAGVGDSPMMGTWTLDMSAGSMNGRTLASWASSGYFNTLGIPLVRGRDFTALDDQRDAPLAIVSESTARLLWPDGDPLGKRFGLDLDRRGNLTEYEVVGVAADVRFANLSRPDPSHVYLSNGPSHLDWLVVRAAGDPTAALAAVRQAAGAVEPDLKRSLQVQSLEQGPMRTQRLLAEICAEFAVLLAALAISLAGIGIYGVMSYLVARRAREIGVLMALGADASQILRGVVLQGLRPVLIGSVVGLAGAAILSKVLNATLIFPGSADLLYGVPWWDPITFVGLTAFLVLIAGVASAIPARRALQVDPMVALRWE